MEAGHRPSLKCVKCRRRPRTGNRLLRISKSHHPPSLRLRKTPGPAGPVSHRTTTVIVRVSRKRMFSPTYKTIRTGRRPPMTPGDSHKAINRETPPEAGSGAPEDRAEADPGATKGSAEKCRGRQKAASQPETTAAVPADRPETGSAAAKGSADKCCGR